MSRKKKTTKPKRRVIEHKPVELTPRQRRNAKINEIKADLQFLDELEEAEIAKAQAMGKGFVASRYGG